MFVFCAPMAEKGEFGPSPSWTIADAVTFDRYSSSPSTFLVAHAASISAAADFHISSRKSSNGSHASTTSCYNPSQFCHRQRWRSFTRYAPQLEIFLPKCLDANTLALASPSSSGAHAPESHASAAQCANSNWNHQFGHSVEFPVSQSIDIQ